MHPPKIWKVKICREISNMFRKKRKYAERGRGFSTSTSVPRLSLSLPFDFLPCNLFQTWTSIQFPVAKTEFSTKLSERNWENRLARLDRTYEWRQRYRENEISLRRGSKKGRYQSWICFFCFDRITEWMEVEFPANWKWIGVEVNRVREIPCIGVDDW